MIIFEVNFLLIYKNIDEFGIVCKKKRVFYKKITIILFGPFFFSLSFFFFFFFFFSSTKCQSWGCGLYGGAAFTPANTVLKLWLPIGWEHSCCRILEFVLDNNFLWNRPLKENLVVMGPCFIKLVINNKFQ